MFIYYTVGPKSMEYLIENFFQVNFTFLSLNSFFPPFPVPCSEVIFFNSNPHFMVYLDTLLTSDLWSFTRCDL
jgi:hypothetical protein